MVTKKPYVVRLTEADFVLGSLRGLCFRVDFNERRLRDEGPRLCIPKSRERRNRWCYGSSLRIRVQTNYTQYTEYNSAKLYESLRRKKANPHKEKRFRKEKVSAHSCSLRLSSLYQSTFVEVLLLLLCCGNVEMFQSVEIVIIELEKRREHKGLSRANFVR